MAILRGLRAPGVGRGGLHGVDGQRIARAVFVDVGRAMANPLPPAIHRHAHQQLDLGHFERRRMPMPHQVANQPAIVRDLARAFAVADAGGLHDRLVVAHHVDQAHEAVVEHGKLFPAELGDLFGVGGHACVSPARIYFLAISSSTSLATRAGLSCLTRCSMRAGGNLQLFERRADVLPLPLAGLALGQIQLGDQLAQPLQRDRLAVLVVVLDDLLLVLRSLSHGALLLPGVELPASVLATSDLPQIESLWQPLRRPANRCLARKATGLDSPWQRTSRSGEARPRSMIPAFRCCTAALR